MLIQLYLVFLKVGALAFGGGLATLPLLQEALVNEHAWLSMTEWTDVFTISNMTPGPIAINAATFVGTKMGQSLGLGLPGQLIGSMVATLGVITPQILLMSLLAYLLFVRGGQLRPLQWAIKALRAATVGLIAAITLALFQSHLFPAEALTGQVGFGHIGGLAVDFLALFCFLASLFGLRKKIDMTKLLSLGALVGVLAEWLL